MTDCKGIVIDGSIDDFHSSGVVVEVFDQRRIEAVRDAAHRHLGPEDQVVQALDQAVRDGFAGVDLPECADEHDLRVLASVLEDVRNGDDRAPERAASELRKAAHRSRYIECPYCHGEGEIAA